MEKEPMRFESKPDDSSGGRTESNDSRIFNERASGILSTIIEDAQSKKSTCEKYNSLSRDLREVAETLEPNDRQFGEIILAGFKADLDALRAYSEVEEKYQQEVVNNTINHYLIKTAQVAMKDSSLSTNPSVIKIFEFLAQAYEGYRYAGTAKDLYAFLNNEIYSDKIEGLSELVSMHGASFKAPGEQELKTPNDVDMLIESLKDDPIMDVNVISFVNDLRKKQA